MSLRLIVSILILIFVGWLLLLCTARAQLPDRTITHYEFFITTDSVKVTGTDSLYSAHLKTSYMDGTKNYLPTKALLVVSGDGDKCDDDSLLVHIWGVYYESGDGVYRPTLHLLDTLYMPIDKDSSSIAEITPTLEVGTLFPDYLKFAFIAESASAQDSVYFFAKAILQYRDLTQITNNNNVYTFDTLAVYTEMGTKADTVTTITAGNGLTGGGSLAANRTINLVGGWGQIVGADSTKPDTALIATVADLTLKLNSADTAGVAYRAWVSSITNPMIDSARTLVLLGAKADSSVVLYYPDTTAFLTYTKSLTKKPYQWTITNPKNVPDTLDLPYNDNGAITIDSIVALSNNDTCAFSLVELARYGGSGSLIDAVDCNVAGTNRFKGVETTISDAAIAAGALISYVKSTDSTESITVKLYWH